MHIDCQVCKRNIKKIGWGEHLRTQRHGIACGSIVVEEEVMKKHCKCRGHKGLDMFRRENATCNGCLAHRKNWRIITQKKLGSCHGSVEEHKETRKAYNQQYNQREVHCEVCGCRVKKCNWLRHLGTRKHRDGVENVEGRGEMGGEGEGAGGTS